MRTPVVSPLVSIISAVRPLCLILLAASLGGLLPAQSPTLTVRSGPAGTVQLEWTALPAAQGYRVEYRNSLTSGAWLPCPMQDQWPQTGTSWLDMGSADRPMRFYRVMALMNQRGAVVSSNFVTALSVSQLSTIFITNGLPLSPQNAVEVHVLRYETVTADGAPTIASGTLVLPRGVGRSLPLLSHQHGTVVLTNEVASQGRGEYLLGLAFGSIGYVTSMPDYLGMGFGSGLHPYVHARSEATAAIDLMRAARTFCALTNVALNGQVFLIGYSQGGQATMAAMREVETYYTNEFALTACAPMAGPHDMSGTMANLLTTNRPYGSPYYLPYTLFSYNSVYRLYETTSEVLLNPYATNLPRLFDGRHSEAQINAVMPATPSQILRPEFLSAFLTNTNHPFRVVLRANDLYRWTPQAPMRMYHCRGDTTVPYVNSEIALNSFRARGATNVALIDPYPAGTHSSGAPYCFLAARSWFDTMKQ